MGGCSESASPSRAGTARLLEGPARSGRGRRRSTGQDGTGRDGAGAARRSRGAAYPLHCQRAINPGGRGGGGRTGGGQNSPGGEGISCAGGGTGLAEVAPGPWARRRRRERGDSRAGG